MRHPLIVLFHLSNLLQMLNDHRMADVEFFVNFSRSCKRIGFDDAFSWLLSPSGGWPLLSSSARLSSPLQNFLNHHCPVHSFQCPIFLPFHTVCGVLKIGDGQGGLVCSSPWGRKELDTTKQLNLEIFLTLYYHYAIQFMSVDLQVCNKG